MPYAIDTAFDVAFWFSDTALNQNEYLQPQKLHRLLYLSQIYYAIATDGGRLMPAIFVADEMGPIEPNIYRAFSKGRPDVEVELFLPESVERFLEGIWRRFGNLPTEKLNKLVMENNAYMLAAKRGPRAHIPLSAMVEVFKQAPKKKATASVQKAFGAKKVLLSQDGVPVTVKSWMPGMATKPEN